MVEIISQILDDQLVAELSKSQLWGLLVDETTDISVAKQLGLVVRWDYFLQLNKMDVYILINITSTEYTFF